MATTFVVVGIVAVASAASTPDAGARRARLAARIGTPAARWPCSWASSWRWPLGFIDDRWQIRARYQLLGQLLLAGHRDPGGIAVHADRQPVPVPGRAFGGRTSAQCRDAPVRGRRPRIQPVPILLTTLWIVGMINSINWIDGLDGLSTGVSLIAARDPGHHLAHRAARVEPIVALLCAVLAGSLAGFLPWNFHPARVFIGTAGRDGRGLRPRGAVDPGHGQGRGRAAGPGRAHHRHLLDHHPARRDGAARRSSPTGAISTTDCWTSASPIGARCCSSTPCPSCWALPASCSRRAAPARCTRSLGVVVAGGLVLYLFTRRTNDALDARSYPMTPTAPTGRSPPDAGPRTPARRRRARSAARPVR